MQKLFIRISFPRFKEWNFTIQDLLMNCSIDKVTGKSQKHLMVREEKNGTIKIENLKAELVNAQKECLQLLNKGI